jgi:hypothetical protein
MPTQRLSMSRIKEVLRLKHVSGPAAILDTGGDGI